jgi:hypothetical protein
VAGQYEFFKNELLNIHQLSDYEKFDMLVKMEPMGGRKPSQLLHAMLEFCPLGMERHFSFHYFFMQRLPQALRTQLGEDSLEILAPSPSEQTACGLCTPPRRPGPSPSPTARRTLRQPA